MAKGEGPPSGREAGDGSSPVIFSKEEDQCHLNDMAVSDYGKTASESSLPGEDLTRSFSSKQDDTLHSLSGIYAEILLVVTGATVLAEILHGSLPLFYIHDYIFLYVLGMGILLFIGVYAKNFRRRFSCASEEHIGEKMPCSGRKSTKDGRASDINIYFKVGTAVFGTIVIITSLLEIISIFTSPNKCINLVSSSQPMLRCIFILLQIYFLKNAQEILGSLGCLRNLVLMHLFATNIAIWIRLLLWESAKDWEGAFHIRHNSSVNWDKNTMNITVHALEFDENAMDASEHYPNHVVHYTSNCWWRVQKSVEMDVTSVQYCLQNSTVGFFWEKTSEFFYPLMAQYYFVIAGVLYILWVNSNVKSKHYYSLNQSNNSNKGDICSRSTKGLFLGSIIFATTLIILTIFYTVNRDMNMMVSIIYAVIFGSSALAALLGLCQVRKMYTWKSSKDIQFIKLFQKIGLIAVFVYGSCSIISGSLSRNKQLMIHSFGAITMIVQGTIQYLLIVQVSRKKIDVSNISEKPGRQAVVFLIFCNISLWILDCFVNWNHLRYSYELSFGDPLWPVVTRFVIPFVVFYRFHSVVTLLDAWVNTYKQN